MPNPLSLPPPYDPTPTESKSLVLILKSKLKPNTEVPRLVHVVFLTWPLLCAMFVRHTVLLLACSTTLVYNCTNMGCGKK